MTPTIPSRATAPRVAQICADLVRVDTTNWGAGTSRGERGAAEYVDTLLQKAGYETTVLARDPERPNVVVRVAGADRDLPGLLVHVHTDVVPAVADDWEHDPFGGEIADGYVWGRGAHDMKDMVAQVVETLLVWSENGVVPRRDVVVAFVADEEDKGEWGALWLVEEHPELFAGVEVAIGEGGAKGELATALDGSDVRLYGIGTAERGTLHMRLTAHGVAGHGSRPRPTSAVATLVRALARVVDHTWPVWTSTEVARYLAETSAALGLEVDLQSDEGVEACIEALGDLGETARFAVRASATPTVLEAGYKTNVIPGVAHATLDVRTPPGHADEVVATIDRLLGPGIEREFLAYEPPVQASADSPWFDAMREAIRAVDPQAVVPPFCLGGGTDAKAFSRLGIACYAFSPLGIDPEGRTATGMHGVDERVPVTSLVAGQEILSRFMLQA